MKASHAFLVAVLAATAAADGILVKRPFLITTTTSSHTTTSSSSTTTTTATTTTTSPSTTTTTSETPTTTATSLTTTTTTTETTTTTTQESDTTTTTSDASSVSSSTTSSCISQPSDCSTDPITNGGFDNTFGPWYASPSNTATSPVVYADDFGHDELGSVFMTLQTTDSSVAFNQDVNNLCTGAEYTISLWYYIASTPASTSWLISVNFGGDFSNAGIGLVLDTWTRLEYTVQPSEVTSTLRIGAFRSYGYISGTLTLYIDDVSITAVAPLVCVSPTTSSTYISTTSSTGSSTGSATTTTTETSAVNQQTSTSSTRDSTSTVSMFTSGGQQCYVVRVPKTTTSSSASSFTTTQPPLTERGL